MKLEVRNLTKQFDDTTALDEVSLIFGSGKIYGLLGRNGAGKTTLINIINNRIFKTSGEVVLDGESLEENDKMLANLYAIGEKTLFPENMKVMNIYKWTKTFYPEFDMEEALRLSELFKVNTKKKIKGLSTGYTSIVKAITAICTNATFTFLDEPVLGLDANHRELLYKVLIESYSKNPRTFVISTHLIEEVSGIIEEIIIINNGKVIREESCEVLMANSYMATGVAGAVDKFIIDKNVLYSEKIGGLKTVCIEGKRPTSVAANIEIGSVDLQKLFIYLTSNIA